MTSAAPPCKGYSVLPCSRSRMRLSTGRPAHRKDQTCGAPKLFPGHRSDPPGLCGPEVLKKLTKPGALILNLSSTYSTVRLIDVACRSSVSATNSGSISYRLRRNVLGPIAVIE